MLTSAFFALAHYDQMPAPIPIFVLALVLGWLYEVTGSLVASAVLHTLFNGFNTTLMVYVLLTNPQALPADTPAVPDKVGSIRLPGTSDAFLTVMVEKK